MAAIPNFETLLLTVHEALGCESPRKKQELRDLRRPTDQHLWVLSDLIDDIFAAIGFDDDAKADAKHSLLKFASFHKALEVGTWTFGAESRQVAWYLLSCVYAPGLARHAAFWQLASAGDSGMPGGDFWYLPCLDFSVHPPRLRMPVAGVLDWLEDLLGQPLHRAAMSWNDGRSTVDPESAKRTLAKWRDGDVPRSSIIESYFAEGMVFDFGDCLEPAIDPTEDGALTAVLAFVKRRRLTPADLRHQIPMPQDDRIEAVLAGRSTAEENRLFVQLMRGRYARPSLRMIRNRLLIARAVQFSIRELGRLLTPGVDASDADLRHNKVLQLFEIYKHVYNLTIQATAVGEDESKQDAWFEQHLPPWEHGDLFLSILPSQRHRSASDLPEVLTSRFASLRAGQPLEDWRLVDAEQNVALFEAKRTRWITELEDMEAFEVARQAIRTLPLDAAMATITSSTVTRMLALTHEDASVRIAAARHMAQLANTDDQRLDAALIHVDIYLNGGLRHEPAHLGALVEDLLHAVAENPARSRRMPQWLNARAKHCLRSNDFQRARAHFREALEACTGDSCGDLPGLLARDLFALEAATKPNGFHVANHERHVRIMAAFDVINGLHHPIATVANQLAAYFWSDLYRPYPGIEPAAS